MDAITIEKYRSAILVKYKLSDASDRFGYIGVKPTPPMIRNLLIDVVRQDLKEDIKIIKHYLELPLRTESYTLIKEIKKETDKFKSVINNLKETSRTRQVSMLDLMAVIVDLDNRPFSSFLQGFKQNLNKENDQNAEDLERLTENYLRDDKFNGIRIIGDARNSIGTLPMDDFYVRLSYLDHDDVQKRESWTVLEKENSFQKVKKRISDLSQDYITDRVFENRRLIVTGNPGVGKSTYARWLCYNWALGKIKNTKPLIYIELKKLVYNTDNFIIQYVRQELSEIGKSLSEPNQLVDYRLILDGFDELTSFQKSFLIENVRGLDYVILTRPYGLIDTNIPDYDSILQIDGFNSLCIHNYISNILNRLELPNKSEAELQNILSKNKVLYDYAHTPLMLSYIVLIYCTSESVEKDLISVNSIYNLQERVYDWVFDYALKKNHGEIFIERNLREQINEFSYHLLIRKQLIYQASFDSEYLNVARTLDDLGLGSVRRRGFQWVFSFHTITFQEFLATKHFSHRPAVIEPKVFLYLTQEPFFWNFGLMLIGMFSSEKVRVDMVAETLNSCELDERGYFNNLYYMLLGECDSHLINSLLGDNLEVEIFDRYRRLYHDEFWQGSILESIVKIVYKLHVFKKRLFIRELIHRLRGLTNIPDNTIDDIFQEENLYYLSDFIEVARSIDEAIILQEILIAIKSLSITSEDIKYQQTQSNIQPKEEKQRADRIYVMNALRLLINELDSFSRISLESQFDALQELYPIVNTLNIMDTYMLEVFVDHIGIPAILPSKYIDESIFQEAIESRNINYLIELSQSMYASTAFDKSLPNNFREYLQSIADILNNDSSSLNRENSEDDFEYLISITIMNLAKSGDVNLIDSMFEICCRYNAPLLTKISDNTGFLNYLNQLIQQLRKTPHEIGLLTKLNRVIADPINIKLSFASVRENLLELFSFLVGHGENIEKDSREFYETIKVLSTIASVCDKDYDKKFFISNIMNINIPSNMKKSILLDIVIGKLFKEFTFYEDRYWNIINEIHNAFDNSISHFIPVLYNQQLYYFKSNHTFLCNLFSLFGNTKIRTDSFVTVHELTSISYYFLRHVRSKLIDSTLLSFFGKILNNKEVQRSYGEILFDMGVVECSLAFVLYYYYEPNSANHTNSLSLHKELSSEPGAKNLFFDNLIEFFEDLQVELSSKTLNELKPILGIKLLSEFEEIIDQRLMNKNKFRVEEFENLLRLK